MRFCLLQYKQRLLLTWDSQCILPIGIKRFLGLFALELIDFSQSFGGFSYISLLVFLYNIHVAVNLSFMYVDDSPLHFVMLTQLGIKQWFVISVVSNMQGSVETGHVGSETDKLLL